MCTWFIAQFVSILTSLAALASPSQWQVIGSPPPRRTFAFSATLCRSRPTWICGMVRCDFSGDSGGGPKIQHSRWWDAGFSGLRECRCVRAAQLRVLWSWSCSFILIPLSHHCSCRGQPHYYHNMIWSSRQHHRHVLLYDHASMISNVSARLSKVSPLSKSLAQKQMKGRFRGMDHDRWRHVWSSLQ